MAEYSSTVATLVTVNSRLRNSDGGTSGFSVCTMRRTNAAMPTSATMPAPTTAGSVQPRGPASVKAQVAAPRLITASPAPSRSSACGRVRVTRLGHGVQRAPDGQRGDRQVDQEGPPPARAVDEPSTHERSESARDATESGPRADGLGPIGQDEDRLQDGQAPGVSRAAPDALEHPCADEHLDVRRRAAQQRRDGEPHGADHEDLAAPVPIAECAAEQDEGGQREQVARQHPLQRADARVQILTDVGERDVDDRGVEHRHRARGDGRRERDPSHGRPQHEPVDRCGLPGSGGDASSHQPVDAIGRRRGAATMVGTDAVAR